MDNWREIPGSPGKMVGLVRFELTTSCTPCKRATRLRYSPNKEGSESRMPSAEASGFFKAFIHRRNQGPFTSAPAQNSGLANFRQLNQPNSVMKTILAPIDFSTATDGVIEAASALARSTDSRVVLLHIVQPPVLTSDYGLALENFQEAIEISEKHSTKRLAEISDALRRSHANLPVETQLVNGPPVLEILDAAKKLDATYIVMGSHGHNAIYDLLVGTTTHGVLRKVICPVVVVPPPQRAKK